MTNAGQYPEFPLAEVEFGWSWLKAQWVKGDPFEPSPEVEGHYRAKARVAASLKPTRVAEIGVRAGYSALAFHMGHPFAEFYGLDLDQGHWGGVAGYLEHAAERLANLPHTTSLLERGDSQTRKTLPPPAWHADLFHVDGCHTPQGCAHDILLALTTGARYVLVDDYDFTEYVTAGADWAIKHFGLTAWYVSDGFRGNVLIRNKK